MGAGEPERAAFRAISGARRRIFLRLLRFLSGEVLPALYRHVHVGRIEFHSQAGPACDLGGDQRRPRPRKRLVDRLAGKSRWCFLKRKENLSDTQGLKLSELLEMNLRTVRAYLLKEDFQRFWNYTYPAWAEKFLDRWCFRTMRSNIESMKTIAKMRRRHRELILNWFRANKQFNNGIVEGLNLKWNLTVRKAFGFRTFNALQIASFHQLGDLPEPQFTHEFY